MRFPEDVKDFAERHTRDRRRRTSDSGEEQGEDADGDGSEASEDVAPRQRKVSHLVPRSIAADQELHRMLTQV